MKPDSGSPSDASRSSGDAPSPQAGDRPRPAATALVCRCACGAVFHAPMRQAGKLVRCPECQAGVRVPRTDPGGAAGDDSSSGPRPLATPRSSTAAANGGAGAEGGRTATPRPMRTPKTRRPTEMREEIEEPAPDPAPAPGAARPAVRPAATERGSRPAPDPGARAEAAPKGDPKKETRRVVRSGSSADRPVVPAEGGAAASASPAPDPALSGSPAETLIPRLDRGPAPAPTSAPKAEPKPGAVEEGTRSGTAGPRETRRTLKLDTAKVLDGGGPARPAPASTERRGGLDEGTRSGRRGEAPVAPVPQEPVSDEPADEGTRSGTSRTGKTGPAPQRTPKAPPPLVRWDAGLAGAALAPPGECGPAGGSPAPSPAPAVAPAVATAPARGTAMAGTGARKRPLPKGEPSSSAGFLPFLIVPVLLAGLAGLFVWATRDGAPPSKGGYVVAPPQPANPELVALDKALDEAESLLDARSFREAEAVAIRATALAKEPRAKARALLAQGRAVQGRKAAAPGANVLLGDDEAVALFEKAIQADPSFLSAYETLLAIWSPALASAESTRQTLDEAVKFNPEDDSSAGRLRVEEKNCLTLRARLQQLISLLTKALSTMPADAKPQAQQILTAARDACQPKGQ